MKPFDQNQLERWLVEEVLPHENDLRSWLCARFPAAGDIDDLVQNSYSKLLRARRTGSIANPKAYLFAVARNLALNQIRHLQYERPEGAEEIDALTIAAEVNSPLESIQHH